HAPVPYHDHIGILVGSDVDDRIDGAPLARHGPQLDVAAVPLLHVLQDRLADLRRVVSLSRPERRRNVIRLLEGADDDELRPADLGQLGSVSYRRPGRPRLVGAHQDPLEHRAPLSLAAAVTISARSATKPEKAFSPTS